MEKGRKYGIKKLSEIFFFVCFIGEKAGRVTRMTYSKEAITLNEIQAMTENAQDYDNCIIFSPFLLSTKIGSRNQTGDGDMLIGITAYDLKNN